MLSRPRKRSASLANSPARPQRCRVRSQRYERSTRSSTRTPPARYIRRGRCGTATVGISHRGYGRVDQSVRQRRL
eukprot:7241993-Prymnesium_polylepis.1